MVDCPECGHPTKECKNCLGRGEVKKDSGYYLAVKKDQEKLESWVALMDKDDQQ